MPLSYRLSPERVQVEQVEEEEQEVEHLLQHVLCLSWLKVPGQWEACGPTLLRRTMRLLLPRGASLRPGMSSRCGPRGHTRHKPWRSKGAHARTRARNK